MPRNKTVSFDQYVLEEGTSGCKKKQLLELMPSTSNHTAAEKSSANLFQEEVDVRRRKGEMKQLEGRLGVLEEEGEVLKGALWEIVEERTKLVNEIYDHFNNIQHRLLQQRELDRGGLDGHDRRPGLLQVLRHESNPSIVNKGSRAKALG